MNRLLIIGFLVFGAVQSVSAQVYRPADPNWSYRYTEPTHSVFRRKKLQFDIRLYEKKEAGPKSSGKPKYKLNENIETDDGKSFNLQIGGYLGKSECTGDLHCLPRVNKDGRVGLILTWSIGLAREPVYNIPLPSSFDPCPSSPTVIQPTLLNVPGKSTCIVAPGTLKTIALWKTEGNGQILADIRVKVIPSFLDRHKDFVSKLIQSLKQHNEQTYQNVSAIIVKLDQDAVPDLISALKGEDDDLRIASARLLGDIAEQGSHLPREAVPGLINALSGGNLKLREVASRTLRIILLADYAEEPHVYSVIPVGRSGY